MGSHCINNISWCEEFSGCELRGHLEKKIDINWVLKGEWWVPKYTYVDLKFLHPIHTGHNSIIDTVLGIL